MRSLFRNITEEMERKRKCLDNREEKAKTKTKRNSKSGINIENSIAFPWVMGRHIGLSAHSDVVIQEGGRWVDNGYQVREQEWLRSLAWSR